MTKCTSARAFTNAFTELYTQPPRIDTVVPKMQHSSSIHSSREKECDRDCQHTLKRDRDGRLRVWMHASDFACGCICMALCQLRNDVSLLRTACSVKGESCPLIGSGRIERFSYRVSYCTCVHFPLCFECVGKVLGLAFSLVESKRMVLSVTKCQ